MKRGPATVLEALRGADGERCSGESLSTQLGVSRAAVWKHVETLRRHGYRIEGAPGDGYSLSAVPDRLYAEELGRDLGTRWLAHEIHYYDAIDSTNRVAFDLARAGAVHGTAVVAEQQTAGRGRLGRAFFSPPHSNLYTSIVLRPKLTIGEAGTMILAAAIAVAETVVLFTAEAKESRAEGPSDDVPEVEIKWPNDVLLRGLKTSGILMEMSAEATRVGYAILGIGVNLNVDPADFPSEFRTTATSLQAHCGHPIDRVAFTQCLYGILEGVLDVHETRGFDSLRGRFEALFRMPGRPVEVLDMNGSTLSGVARGIAGDGALLVERADGTTERVIAGDVTLSGSLAEPESR